MYRNTEKLKININMRCIEIRLGKKEKKIMNRLTLT